MALARNYIGIQINSVFHGHRMIFLQYCNLLIKLSRNIHSPSFVLRVTIIFADGDFHSDLLNRLWPNPESLFTTLAIWMEFWPQATCRIDWALEMETLLSKGELPAHKCWLVTPLKFRGMLDPLSPFWQRSSFCSEQFCQEASRSLHTWKRERK